MGREESETERPNTSESKKSLGKEGRRKSLLNRDGSRGSIKAQTTATFGNFVVSSVVDDLGDERYVDSFTIRLPFTMMVGDIKQMIVRASKSTATPFSDDFAFTMKLILGDRELLDNSHRLKDYTVGDNSHPLCPKGYHGVLFIANDIAGAPLVSTPHSK